MGRGIPRPILSELFPSLALFISHSNTAQESWGGKKPTLTLHGIRREKRRGEGTNQIQSAPHVALKSHSPISALLLGQLNGVLAQAEKMDLIPVIYLVWSKRRSHLCDSWWSSSGQMLDKLGP